MAKPLAVQETAAASNGRTSTKQGGPLLTILSFTSYHLNIFTIYHFTIFGVEEPERGVTADDIDEIEERIRKKYWSLRGIIVEEAAYLNRSGLRQGLPERMRLFRIRGRCLGGKNATLVVTDYLNRNCSFVSLFMKK